MSKRKPPKRPPPKRSDWKASANENLFGQQWGTILSVNELLNSCKSLPEDVKAGMESEDEE